MADHPREENGQYQYETTYGSLYTLHKRGKNRLQCEQSLKWISGSQILGPLQTSTMQEAGVVRPLYRLHRHSALHNGVAVPGTAVENHSPEWE